MKMNNHTIFLTADEEINSLISTFFIDAIIFILCLFFFYCIGRRRTWDSDELGNNLLKFDVQRAHAMTLTPRKLYKYPFYFECIRRILVPKSQLELLNQVHCDGALYLRFMLGLFIVLLYSGIVSLIFVLPLCIFGGGNMESTMERLSAGNIPEGDLKQITLFFVTLIICAFSYIFAYYFGQDITTTLNIQDTYEKARIQLKKHNNYLKLLPNKKMSSNSEVDYEDFDTDHYRNTYDNSDQDRNTVVHLWNLKRNLTDEKLLIAILENFIDKARSDKTHLLNYHHQQVISKQPKATIITAHIVPLMTKWQKLQDQYDQYKKRLEAAQVKITNLHRPTVADIETGFCDCFSTITTTATGSKTDDACVFYEGEMAKLDVFITQQAHRRHPSTGHSFVTFRSHRDAQECVRVIGLGIGGVRASFAPPASMILWENLGKTWKWLLFLFGNSALVMMSIFLVTPVTVLDQLEPIIRFFETNITNSSIRIFLTDYFPAVIIYVVNSLILPFLINWCADYESHIYLHLKVASSLPKQTLFLFINTILLPLISINSVQKLVDYASKTDWGDWTDVIGTRFLSASSQFFFIYMIHAILLGSGIVLTDIPQRIWRRFDSSSSNSNERWPWDFGYYYASRLTISALCLTLGVCVPLIIPFGLFYLLFNFYVDKHNLTHGVYTIGINSKGHLSRSVVLYFLLYIVFFQFCMGCYFYVQNTYLMRILGLTLWGCMIITCVVYVLFTLTHRIDMSWITDYRDSESYVHPLLRDRELRNHLTNLSDLRRQNIRSPPLRHPNLVRPVITAQRQNPRETIRHWYDMLGDNRYDSNLTTNDDISMVDIIKNRSRPQEQEEKVNVNEMISQTLNPLPVQATHIRAFSPDNIIENNQTQKIENKSFSLVDIHGITSNINIMNDEIYKKTDNVNDIQNKYNLNINHSDTNSDTDHENEKKIKESESNSNLKNSNELELTDYNYAKILDFLKQHPEELNNAENIEEKVFGNLHQLQ